MKLLSFILSLALSGTLLADCRQKYAEREVNYWTDDVVKKVKGEEPQEIILELEPGFAVSGVLIGALGGAIVGADAATVVSPFAFLAVSSTVGVGIVPAVFVTAAAGTTAVVLTHDLAAFFINRPFLKMQKLLEQAENYHLGKSIFPGKLLKRFTRLLNEKRDDQNQLSVEQVARFLSEANADGTLCADKALKFRSLKNSMSEIEIE